jgi:mono/diheme cytochrome c family protein
MSNSFLAVVSLALAPQTPESPPTPRALFIQLCAACHGESGDGKGTTALEKPARSFLSGGFSYGNTPEALLRTITFGIPGTPMPSFASALSETQRKELAELVRAFAPPAQDVAREGTLLLVRDEPLFARGKLAPIVEGAPETVRGLLAGTLDGSTFEWRVDDVRLLGVRRGEFVERRDWSGRGGEALLPLGKLVHVRAGGRPGPAFAWRAEGGAEVAFEPLLARLRATRAVRGETHVAYRLARDAGSANFLADVDERLAAANAGALTGYTRSATFAVHASASGALAWCVAEGAGAVLVEHGERWVLRRGADGVHELTWLRVAPRPLVLDATAERVSITGSPSDFASGALDVVTLLPAAWNGETRAAWRTELAR